MFKKLALTAIGMGLLAFSTSSMAGIIVGKPGASKGIIVGEKGIIVGEKQKGIIVGKKGIIVGTKGIIVGGK